MVQKQKKYWLQLDHKVELSYNSLEDNIKIRTFKTSNDLFNTYV